MAASSALKFIATKSAPLDWGCPPPCSTVFREIRERARAADFILEVRDARLPLSSANEELQEILRQKRHLLVLNKMDLANPKQDWERYFQAQGTECIYVNGHNQDSVKSLMRIMRSRLTKHISYNKPILTMVVGIPNVGKSALMNTAHRIGRHQISRQEKLTLSEVGPLPGVTRTIMSAKVGHTPPIYMLDTPGLLHTSIPDLESGLKLAVTGAINDEIIGEERLARYLLALLNSQHSRYHVKWKAEAEAKAFLGLPETPLTKREMRLLEQDVKVEVRGAIASPALNCDICLEDASSMESLIGLQMQELQRVFKLSEDYRDSRKIVAEKLINLYRTGKLGGYNWDEIPSYNN